MESKPTGPAADESAAASHDVASVLVLLTSSTDRTLRPHQIPQPATLCALDHEILAVAILEHDNTVPRHLAVPQTTARRRSKATNSLAPSDLAHEIAAPVINAMPLPNFAASTTFDILANASRKSRSGWLAGTAIRSLGVSNIGNALRNAQ